MTGARSYVVVVGCVLAALASSVVAQPARADRAKAASHFKQGQLYFKAADYERAISEYQTAYALSLEPLLLFNIALCNDRAQRPEKALEGFQRYLDLAPDGEVAEEAREDVARLTPIVEGILAKRAAELHAEETLRAEQARTIEEAHRADQARSAEVVKRERDRRQAEAAARAAPLDRRARLERGVGIAAAGAGALALGLGLDARADGGAITNHTSGAWSDALLAKDSEGHAANTKMLVFTTLGGVCVLGGGALYVLGLRAHHEADQLRVVVHPTDRGGAAFAISGHF